MRRLGSRPDIHRSYHGVMRVRVSLSALLAGAALASGQTSPPTDSVTAPDLGVAAYPGSSASPALTGRLELLRNVRWRAVSVMQSDAPMREVLEHFRREQRRIEAAAGTGAEPTGRLREWLEAHPADLAKYREYRRSQSGNGPTDWQVLSQRASEIPLSLGGGEAFRGKAFAGRDVEVAFGRITLADSTATIQLVSPRPSDDGRNLQFGTLIAVIREARDAAPATTGTGDETVRGPEDRELAAGLRGVLLMDEPIGGMVAVSLPRLKRSVVRAPGSGVGVVHALSGPDEAGRIAYLENHASAGRHSLKSMGLDGREEELLFERPGDAVFERVVGSGLALSPRGGRVALIGRLTRFQTNRPVFPLRIGPLEVWDVRTKSGAETGIQALDRRMAWFPDGTRLAYVELVPSARADGVPGRKDASFGVGFRGWEAVPVVRILDVLTGRRRTLHLGWDPVISADGRSVLLRDGDNRWRLADAETGLSRPVDWPGDAGGAIALGPGGLVLYWGLPTQGSPAEFTRIYSESVGPRPMKTLKVAELSTRRFQTLVGSVDPRREVSFGSTAP